MSTRTNSIPFGKLAKAFLFVGQFVKLLEPSIEIPFLRFLPFDIPIVVFAPHVHISIPPTATTYFSFLSRCENFKLKHDWSTRRNFPPGNKKDGKSQVVCGVPPSTPAAANKGGGGGGEKRISLWSCCQGRKGIWPWMAPPLRADNIPGKVAFRTNAHLCLPEKKGKKEIFFFFSIGVFPGRWLEMTLVGAGETNFSVRDLFLVRPFALFPFSESLRPSVSRTKKSQTTRWLRPKKGSTNLAQVKKESANWKGHNILYRKKYFFLKKNQSTTGMSLTCTVTLT